MIYLDANIFIYPVVNEGKDIERYEKLLFKIAKGEINACTSVLTWDEVAYNIGKLLGKEIGLTEGKKFLNLPNLILYVVDKDIIAKAQEVTEKYNLKQRDAIHAATMLQHNITEIISDDSDFDKVKEIKRIKP